MRPSKILLSLTLLLFAVSYVSAHPADKPDVKVKIEVAYMPQAVVLSVDGVMVHSEVSILGISSASGFTPFVVVVGGKHFLPAPDYPYTTQLYGVITKHDLEVNPIDLKPDLTARLKFHYAKYNRDGHIGFTHKLPPKIFYKGDSRCAS